MMNSKVNKRRSLRKIVGVSTTLSLSLSLSLSILWISNFSKSNFLSFKKTNSSTPKSNSLFYFNNKPLVSVWGLSSLGNLLGGATSTLGKIAQTVAGGVGSVAKNVGQTVGSAAASVAGAAASAAAPIASAAGKVVAGAAEQVSKVTGVKAVVEVPANPFVLQASFWGGLGFLATILWWLL